MSIETYDCDMSKETCDEDMPVCEDMSVKTCD